MVKADREQRAAQLVQASERMPLPPPLALSTGSATTLDDAQRLLRVLVRAGEHCPCCGRWAQIYPLTITSGAAYALLWVVKHSKPGEFIHLPTKADRTALTTNSIGRLRFWGLSEREPNSDTAKKHPGTWRATEAGRLWVLDKSVTVPRYQFVWDDRCLLVAGEGWTIVDALGKKFDYSALMEGRL